MKNVYLVLAIIGAIVPYAFFTPYIMENGLDLAAFVSDLYANGAAGGAFSDLLVSSAVFWIYMFSHKNGPKPWLFIALNLGIGLSCALPAYLYAREKSAA